MIIDVIMLSKGDTPAKRSMTQNAINSIHGSEFDIQFNIIVVENIPKVVYKGCTNIHPEKKFHYNEFTKIGYSHCDKSDYILFVNNDIKAYKGFASELVKALDIYDSVSPMCPRVPEHRNLPENYNEGLAVRARFAGWAFMMKRATVDGLGLAKLFPMDLHAWYSDNWVAHILANNGLKHALVRSSKIEHFASVTLKSLDKEEGEFYTTGQKEKFDDLLASFDDLL